MFIRRAFAPGASKTLFRSPLYSARGFHASAPAFVQVGDAIPDVELVEDSPGNKVSIAKELKGKGVIIGVPAAFSKIVSSVNAADMSLISSKAQHAPRHTFQAISARAS